MLRSESYSTRVIRRFIRSTTAVIGALILVVMILLATLAPWITSKDYRAAAAANRFRPPSVEHPFGTDRIGRDLYTRILLGGRISLLIGAVSVVIATVIGTSAGAVAGYAGGRTDSAIMRFTDVFMSIPSFFLILILAGVFGASTLTTMIVIGVVGWPGCARIARGEILRLKSRDFVQAAVAEGATDLRIIVSHLLPNIVAPITVFATLFAASAIITEAGLSFLGLGAQPPNPSWGNILSEGRRDLAVAWWVATIPGLMILVTVMGLNLMGDGLRDALDPTTRSQ